MGTNAMFRKAVKFEAKGRIALVGPAGAGKSYTMLIMARMLAGPTGKIAAIDTEHGSLSKYADLFDFDVMEMDSFSPSNFITALHAAEEAGYDVICCDSLSHFWVGKDGALEYVDQALAMARSRSRSGRADDMSGWKEFRPHERSMVDAMIASPCHVIVTMRTKTAYEEQVGNDGKKHRIKIGLAPVQREGLEYEFDLVGYMDDDNTLIVDKTRCPAFSGKAINKPTPQALAPFAEWLKGSARPAPAAQTTQPAQPSNGNGRQQRNAPAVPAKVDGWKLEQDQLSCFVYEAQKRTSNRGEYIALKHNGKVSGKDMAFCFHASLFDALEASRGLCARLQVEASGDYVNITDVIEIDGVSFIDGKPVVPGTAVTAENPITDSDIPF